MGGRLAALAGALVLAVWLWSRASEVGDHWQHVNRNAGDVLWLVAAVVGAAVLTWVAIRPRRQR